MKFSAIKFNLEKNVAWITLNRPSKLNAITPDMLDELTQSLKKSESDTNIRAVVISGEGRAFSAGADLQEVNDPHPHAFRHQLTSFIMRLRTSRLPVIAAVNGIAVAGGFELLLGCDIVIAAESAKLGDGHSKYGMVPGGGGSVFLPRKIGANAAKEILFSGDLYPADFFYRRGLVNQVTADTELKKVVRDFSHKLSQKSPLVLSRMKQLVNHGLEQPLSTAIDHEFVVADLHDASQDKAEGIKAFEEKRSPKFLGE